MDTIRFAIITTMTYILMLRGFVFTKKPIKRWEYLATLYIGLPIGIADLIWIAFYD